MSQTNRKSRYVSKARRVAEMCGGGDPELKRILETPTQKGEWHGRGENLSYLAGANALLYKLLGEEEFAREARRYLLFPESKSGFSAMAGLTAYRILKEGGLLSEEDVQFVREENRRMLSEYLVQHAARNLGFRRYNHATVGGAWAQMLLAAFPELYATTDFEQWADSLWSEWWAIKENQEVTSNYEAFSQVFITELARLRGLAKEYFAEPIVRNMFERAAANVSTFGAMTPYGDSSFMTGRPDWCAWLEIGAHAYADGRLAFAAEQLCSFYEKTDYIETNLTAYREFDASDIYAVRQACFQIPELPWYFALCAVRCDLSVRPVAPPSRPRITYRVLPNVDAQWTSRSKPAIELEPGERRCEKLILRGGHTPSSPYMALALGRRLNHHHYEAGAVLLYTSGNTILLKNADYLQREPHFHNLLAVTEADRPFPGTPPHLMEESSLLSHSYDGEVRGLCDFPEVTFALTEFKGFQDVPVRHQRWVLFVKDGPTLIYDLAKVEGGRWRIGPIFHSEKVLESGTDYFVARLEQLRGMNGLRWANPPGNLFLAFPCQAGQIGQTEMHCDFFDNEFPHPVSVYVKTWESAFNMRQCMHQSRLVEEGETARFVSLLSGFTEQDGRHQRAQLSAPVDEPGRSLVGFGQHLFGVCEEGAIESDKLNTDARMSYVRRAGEKTVVCLHCAQNLSLPQEALHLQTEGPSRVDARFEISPDCIEGRCIVPSQAPAILSCRRGWKNVILNDKKTEVKPGAPLELPGPQDYQMELFF